MGELKRKILGAIEPYLKEIEERLEHNLSPEFALVREIGAHILFSGGKRIRPLLCVLVYRSLGGREDKIFDIAGIFEFLHAATLLHDDVLDEALKRRGRKAAHSVFGASEAVLAGDYLLARSLNLSARLTNSEIIATIAGLTEKMVQGEIKQLRNKGRLDISEAEYDEVIKAKTAVLLEGACKTGALMLDAEPEILEAVSSYGRELGMAFQMIDDLLDYTGDEASLGKLPGADLREGKATLPLIKTLAVCDKELADFINKIAGTDFSEDDFILVKNAVELAGGSSWTRQRAESHLKSASKALEILPDSYEKEILSWLLSYMLDRKN